MDLHLVIRGQTFIRVHKEAAKLLLNIELAEFLDAQVTCTEKVEALAAIQVALQDATQVALQVALQALAAIQPHSKPKSQPKPQSKLQPKSHYKPHYKP